MHSIKIVIYLLSATALWAMGGCAATPEVVKERIFFPFPPDKPKIEFIDAHQGENTFPKSAAKKRKEFFLGEDPYQLFGRPKDVASDGEGRLYVADQVEKNVWVVDLVNYKMTRLTEDPLFVDPVGLAVGGEGNVYVADARNKKVYVFDKEKRPLFSISGAAVATVADLDWVPVGLAVDDKLGRLYVTDRVYHKVHAFDKKGGEYLFSIGKGQGDVDEAFNTPVDVAVAPDGRVVVIDTMNARVQVFDSDGKFLNKFGRRGSSPDSFGLIKGAGIDTEGHLYIADAEARMIKIYDLDGNYLMPLGGAVYEPGPGKPLIVGGFNSVVGMDVDKKNRIFVVDQMNKMVQIFQYLDEDYLKEHPLPKVVSRPSGAKGPGEKTGGAAK